jgi:sugar lactone lactonase YvrE
LVTIKTLLPISWGLTCYHTGHTFNPNNVLTVGDTSYFENMEIEVLAFNKGWSEGPAWNPEEKALYYSDVWNYVIYRWTQETGAEVFIKKSGGHNPNTNNIPDYEKRQEPGSNGLAVKDGWLYIC